VTDLADPGLHHLADVVARRLRDAVPEVLADRVAVQVLLQVDRHALEEDLLADVVRQHAKNRTGLRVRKAVKDLVRLVCVWASNLDRVRRQLRVELERTREVFVDEAGVDLPLWVQDVCKPRERMKSLSRRKRLTGDDNLTHQRGETCEPSVPRTCYVSPYSVPSFCRGLSATKPRGQAKQTHQVQVVPPLHRRDVAEPLVCDLVALVRRDALLRLDIRLLRVEAVRARAAGDQALPKQSNSAFCATKAVLPSSPSRPLRSPRPD
jgi:hypothetical protein